MATLSSILAWEVPCIEEPGGLQSVGLQRVEHDIATKQQSQQDGLTLLMRITGCADLASWKCWFLLPSYNFLFLWGESKLAKMAWSGFLAPQPLTLAPCFINDYVTAVSEGSWHECAEYVLGFLRLNLLGLDTHTSSPWLESVLGTLLAIGSHALLERPLVECLLQTVYSGQTPMDFPLCSHRCTVFTNVCCLNGFF